MEKMKSWQKNLKLGVYAGLWAAAGLHSTLNAKAIRTAVQENGEDISADRPVMQIMKNFREQTAEVLNTSDWDTANLALTYGDLLKTLDRNKENSKKVLQLAERGVFFQAAYLRSSPTIKHVPLPWPQPLPQQFGEFLAINTTANQPDLKKFSTSALGNFIGTAFPSGWNNNLTDFNQEIATVNMQEDYGMSDDKAEATTFAFFSEREAVKAKILYHVLPVYNDDEPAFTKHIAHEICHVNDPYNINYLGLSERIETLKKIVDRVQSDNAFGSDYVKKIGVVNGDFKHQNFRRSKEYFAEICAAWLEDDVNLPFEDALLMQEWVSQIDPSFNPEKYRVARDKFLEAGQTENLQDLLKQLNPEIREELEIVIKYRELSKKIKNIKAGLDSQMKKLTEVDTEVQAALEAKKKGMVIPRVDYVKKVQEILKEAHRLDRENDSIIAELQVVDKKRQDMLKKRKP